MFYGWRVVGGSFLSQAFAIGFFTYAISLITVPVQQSFDVSIEMVMYSLTFGTFVGLIAMPVAGVLLDRLPARGLFAAGLLFFSLGLWLLGETATIAQYIVVFGLTMALVNALAGSMISSAVVSRWFAANRGKALGVAATGTSIGGVLVPWLITYWLPDYGWRGALQNLSIVILVGVLPIVLWTIRGWPSDIGVQVEQLEHDPDADGALLQLGVKDILRNPNFWWLGISLGLLFSSYSAILANLTPYATQLGHEGAAASRLIMVVAIFGLLGKLVFGAAADVLSHKWALWTAQLLLFTGFLLLAQQPSYSLVILACVLLGLAAGGMLPIWGALIAEIFGLQSYGRAFGLMGPLITVFVMLGFPLVGRLFDVTGDFNLGLWISSALMTVAAVLLVPLRLANKS